MPKDMILKTRKECINCNACTKNCNFLTKYGINLNDFSYRDDLKFSCFLCDKCLEVCPKNLSGKEIALELRQSNPPNTTKIELLKNNYKFKNNSNKKSEYLLFLGCNYPGTYPKTCEKLINICKEKGIDFSIDCCKKPVYEFGGKADFKSIEKLCEVKGTKTLICACPNCYHLLKEKLNINVISVYEFLYENGIGKKIDKEIPIFFPCSDRISKKMFSHIEKFVEKHKSPYDEVNCCGLGGGAREFEKDLLEEKKEKLHKLWEGSIYTYCASCSGIFNKYKLKNIKNILSEILEVKEEPSDSYGINVIKYKFKSR